MVAEKKNLVDLIGVRGCQFVTIDLVYFIILRILRNLMPSSGLQGYCIQVRQLYVGNTHIK